MPTICRFDGLNVVIYPADHVPAHVHVIGGGSEAVFNLNCPDGPVLLRENFGFSRPTLAGIRNRLNVAVPTLCGEWSKIHGRA